jgi:putative addiction module killer protein
VATVTLTVREYLTAKGDNPFRSWLGRLDVVVRARIQARILRFESGNLGDHRSVGLGVWEARCAFGPGYRVYFAQPGSTIVLLLVGGDKGSQRADIRTAQRYWIDYQEGQRHGTAK